MERAIRAVSVERGEDPRDYPLVAFGGCGGLHACELAESLGIRTVIIPRMAGVLSALGMLLADRQRDFSIGALGASDYEARFRKLEKLVPRGAKKERFADVRYAGQSYELTIPWGSSFHEAHQRVYGYSDLGRATQIVTLRLRATIGVQRPVIRGGEADYGSSTFVPPGWKRGEDAAGSLVLRLRRPEGRRAGPKPCPT
jgi:N-methylhydantoinase A